MIAWFIIGILGIIAVTVVLMVVRAGLQLFLEVKKPEPRDPSPPADE